MEQLGLDAGKEALKTFGSELKAFYMTMGRYDIVAVSEAPDDVAAAKVALTIGAAGNVTTETLPAFTEHEYRDIVTSLSSSSSWLSTPLAGGHAARSSGRCWRRGKPLDGERLARRKTKVS